MKQGKLKRLCVKLAASAIPCSTWRRDFRNYFLKSSHPIYGRIYPPIYEMSARINGLPPELYNRNGERMEVFFIRDRHSALDPYGLPSPSRFLWDHYNFALDTHFYTHNQMLERMGSPSRCYGMLTESEGIVPEDYNIFRKHKGLESDFTAIFTYSEKVLNEVSNAKFLPSCATVWYGTERGGGTLDDRVFERKTRNISIVSSAKCMCELHAFRITAARLCRSEGLADAFGTFDGGKMVKIADTLAEYRYSIAIENFVSPYFFTEKITNCFAAMTVPIYLGSSRIGDYFNEDGIIRLSPKDDIRKVISQCGARDYESRIEAIKDNYKRALAYRNIYDMMYDKYLRGASKAGASH